MLRASLNPVRGCCLRRPLATSWPAIGFVYTQQTFYAHTKPSIHNPTPLILPGSQSKTASNPVPPPPGSVASPSSDTSIPPERVPKIPPAPHGKIQTSPPSSIPPSSKIPPPPPPPSQPATPPKQKKHRFRRFLLTLIFITALGYGTGVWYSLKSDNFHDFFTEYVPYGEEAVGYLEELEFHRRFPNARIGARTPPASTSEDKKVTIPGRSGVSWYISEDERKGRDLTARGSHMSALEANESPKSGDAKDNSTPIPTTPANASSQAVETKSKSSQPEAEEQKIPANNKQAAKPSKVRLNLLEFGESDEPIVLDLVKVLNGIITAVNANNATEKYANSIETAKEDLTTILQRILVLKDTERQAAQEEVRREGALFDEKAKELMHQVEQLRKEDELQFRDEFQAERERIVKDYEGKLQAELERERKLQEQKLRNSLIEQAVEMKRQFMEEIEQRVETEREGRLSKLSELSSELNDLQKLTVGWNGVIDTNLKTQHMQVAVDAVRTNLEESERPKPFVKELIALKEIAEDNAVVDAAIASIDPNAYRHGIPTTDQIIDRFRRVANEVRKASLLPENAGVASHAVSLILSKILFRKSGLAVGSDVESILTRTQTYLEEGNLDEAAREMNSLQGWAKTLSQDWLREVRRVLEVQQALDVISTEARLQSLRVD